MKTKKNYVKIEDDDPFYDPDLFIIPHHYKDSIENVILPHGLIHSRVSKLAQNIQEDYGSESVTLLCVLKGGFRFCQDLMTSIAELNRSAEKTVQMNVEFIKAKSYLNEQQGDITLSSHGSALDLKEKNVVIVEDCIDSGKTMEKLLQKISEDQPKSLKCACLLLKRNKNATGYRPDYLGFDIPDVWIAGYGIDYNENFRGLEHIVTLNEHGKTKYRK